MSSATGFVLLVSLALAFSPVYGAWWDWFDWSVEEPANCPHENHDTHTCSTLKEQNATCMTFKCCSAFADDEEYEEFDSDSSTSEDDENVYYLGSIFDSCRMCVAVKSCSVYKCHRRCCDGYEEDHYGRCQNNTGHIQCQNGGTQVRYYWNQYFCKCPEGFEGKSCEIPICHHNCENGGECTVKDGKPFCNCSYGHTGERCEISECSTQCQNGGQCFRNGTYELCRCPHNYIGKHCETYFKQPDSCPVPDTWHSYCGELCTSNTDCKDEKICCKEGCTTICREPKVDYCEYEGRRLRIGQTFQPDACKNCTCTSTGRVLCSSMSCRSVTCQNGVAPVQKPGKCCPTCPDNPPSEEPVIFGCPDRTVYLNTSLDKNYAMISVNEVPIHAYGRVSYRRLEVEFSPRYVRHWHFQDGHRRGTAVQASATDSYGNRASCTFKVIVVDNQQPSFTSCPEDIYVFEDTKVKWEKPSYYDNVEVARMTCTDKRNGQYFPVGRHALTYQLWDYDDNSAFCRFYVSVSSRDTDISELPQGLRDQSKDKDSSRLFIILGPVIGGIILVAVAVILFLCCRRKKAGTTARAPGRQAPAFDNNIYTTPGDISIKLPPYSDLPMNPPAYSITGTEKDVSYISLAPPSYTNPGYETLKVHLKKTESMKSTKSEAESEPEK